MIEDGAGAGEGLEERVDVAEVARRLQDPALAHVAALTLLPLEELELFLQVDVGGRPVLLRDPRAIGREIREGFGHVGEERVLEEHDLLVGGLRIPGMDRGLSRIGFQDRRDLCFRERNARIGLRPVYVEGRCGEADLPPIRGVIAGITRHDAVEHGRAGPHEAHDHDRGAELLPQDLRMTPDPLLRPEPHLEALDDPCAHHHAPELIERRLFPQRLQQDPERLAERIGPEIGKPRPRLRVGKDGGGVERGAILGTPSGHDERLLDSNLRVGG